MYFKNVQGQLARWLVKLQLYDFNIVYRRERKHGNADALSRRPSAEQVCGYCFRKGNGLKKEVKLKYSKIKIKRRKLQ